MKGFKHSPVFSHRPRNKFSPEANLQKTNYSFNLETIPRGMNLMVSFESAFLTPGLIKPDPSRKILVLSTDDLQASES